MVKITPKVRTILLSLLLIGSYFTTYANAISSFLTPTETDTRVSFFKVSTDEVSPVFENFISQKINSDRLLSIDISEKAIARFNALNKFSSNNSSITDYFKTTKQFALFNKPTISGITIPDICQGADKAILYYTSTTPNANKYSIVFSDDAKTQGFNDVQPTGRTFTGSSGSINIPVPTIPAPGPAPGSYDAKFYLSKDNSQSDPYSIKIVILPNPTISSPANKDPELCINTLLSSIQFIITSPATGASATGLPSGVTGNYSNGTFTVSGTPSMAGTFNYTVTTSGKCVQKSQSGTITVKPDPTISAPTNKDQELCINTPLSSIQFDITSPATGAGVTGLPGGLSGSYSNGKFTVSGSPSVAGTFNYTITTTGACVQKSQSGTITVKPDPTISAPTNKDQELCINTPLSSIQFDITSPATGAGVTGLPSGITGSYSNGKFTVSGSPSVAGTFNYTVTTTGACVQKSQSGTITVKPDPTISAPTNNDQELCINTPLPSIQFDVTSPATGAGVTGLPSGITGSYSNGKFTVSGSPSVAGTFNYTVTTTGACVQKSQSGTIIVHPTTTFTKPSNIVACNSEIISANNFAGGTVTGTTYNWTNNNTAIGLGASGTGNLPSFTAINNSSAQIIAEITVTPIANNCPGESQTFTIKVNPSIDIELELIAVTCNGEKNGSINITSATGGNGTLRFSLDNINFETKTILNNLYAGVYTIYVKDAEVCSYQIDVEITEPEEVSSTLPTSTDETCFSGINGVHDGSITAGTINGGSGVYQYSIDNSTFQDSPNFTGLAAGNYTIFIKDENDCSTQSNITVGSLSEMKATLTKNDIKCFEDTTGTIKINNPTGGSGSYEYQVINNNNPTGNEPWVITPEITGLPSGVFQVNIRDLNYKDCVITLNNNYILSQPNDALSATTSSTRTLMYGSPTGTATVTPEGGTSGYFYEWRKDGDDTIIQNTQTATNLIAGNYNVLVKDSKGCSLDQVLHVEIIDNVDPHIIKTSRCLSSDDQFRTSTFRVDADLIQGGVGDPETNFQYKWDFGQNATPSNTNYSNNLNTHTVTYNSKGDKTITLWIKDSSGYESSYTYDHFVGECFSGCDGGSSQNFIINEENYFIGDKDGNELTSSYCPDEKYLYIDIVKSANAHTLDVEMIYSTKVDDDTTVSGRLTQCFGTVTGTSNNGDNIYALIPDNTVFQLFKVDSNGDPGQDIIWTCGQVFAIDQIRVKFTVNKDKQCGEATRSACVDNKNITEAITPVLANVYPTHIMCHGDSLGSLSIIASGGIKPYRYSIEGDVEEKYVSTKDFYSLPAGDYQDIWIQDATGRSYKYSENGDGTPKIITINQPASKLEASIKADTILCFGGSTLLTASASGGTAPYTYEWNDASIPTSKEVTLTAGEYSVTVTDSNGCQDLFSISITEPVELTTPAAGQDQSFNCGIISTTLQANAPDVGVGKWVIQSGSGGSLSDDTDPLATLSGEANTTYLLEWTIANPDGTCLKSDEVSIAFTNDCSSLDFDGIDDHVNFEDNYNFPTGKFTFEVWVKPDAIDGVRTILSKRNSSNLGSGGYDLIINNGAPTFRWGNISVSTSSKLTTSRWYHLSVTYDGEKYILYVDGLEVGSKEGLNPVTNENPFILGAMYNNNSPEVPSNYFNGWIEELRIWNKALTENQLHFLMNQRLQTTEPISENTTIRGNVLPIDAPGQLTWASLRGYYQLIASEVTNGITLDEINNGINGILKNIETNQDNSAPLPYTSGANGVWSDKNTWSRPDVWSYPNAKGINDQIIDWNIVETSHNISSGGQDLTLLGLNVKGGKIKMYDPNYNQGQNGGENENNPGQGLIISHYLRLDGNIYLIGDSQLVQPQGSILEASSSGFIKKDQQGTASSYNYNYWSSPVVPQANAINSTYTVASVLMDGTIPNSPRSIDFGNGVTYADGPAGNPRKISNYWIYKFRGKADEYSDYQHIGSTGTLAVGEGFTMKGTSGNAAITDRQNYVYKGKPNNGDISLTVGEDQNYLLGNPYPSALDANKFILDNLNASGGTNSNNIFNGALYFWDHFAGKTHTLREYVGGYATYNLIGGVKAIATDDRINTNTNDVTSNDNVPGQYIPVGQGFFISTLLDDDLSGNYTVDGGDVLFKNSQRAFVRENTPASHFLGQEKVTKSSKGSASNAKIRLDFSSPLGYLRQILVGTSEHATNGYDLGYDAALNDYNLEDFFWLIDNREYVIQGVEHFNVEQVLPIGVYISQKGEFSIEINKLENVPEETNIYLKDIEEDKYYDLKESKFKMEVEPGAYYERFEIVFFKPEAESSETTDEETTTDQESETDHDTTTGSEEEEEEEEEVDELITEYISILDIDIDYISRDRELAISNPFTFPIKSVEIYNLLGQRIQQYVKVPNQKEIRLPVSEYATGIYIVKLFTENSQISKNIILKQ